MHMADALISPAVGGVMWAATGATMAVAAKGVKETMDDRKIPLMGVLGAFIFAAQMINFTIPGTGSSGHLGGGLILAALLGPHAAFLTMASILTVQALFFADGGLLALGCNIFNLGVFPAYVAYPFIFKPMLGEKPTAGRLTAASMITAIVGLQLGAFGVVLQTVFSGISELPVSAFLAAMQPIHLAIGIVEGLVSAAVISFIWKARPEIIEGAVRGESFGRIPMGKVLAVLAAVTLVTGGALSWFASGNPDGLEWSMAKVSGKEELESDEGIHESLAGVQEKTAFLPDYGFKKPEAPAAHGEGESSWPAVDAGTSTAGFVGGAITLLLAAGIGLALRRKKTGAG
jgi:cobalt/nickel transport system permease protein